MRQWDEQRNLHRLRYRRVIKILGKDSKERIVRIGKMSAEGNGVSISIGQVIQRQKVFGQKPIT
ncbi:hypothetical protein ACFLV5_00260 [Chloroflexota bacterium]